MTLDKPKASYRRGWGPNGSDASEVIAAWTLYLQDMNNNPVSIPFDVTNDDSPIVVGMDVKQCTTTNNLCTPPTMTIRRPTDRSPRLLETYMTNDDPLRARLRLLVAPARLSTAMLGDARKPHGMRAITLAKRIHNMTHIPRDEAIRICKDAGWNNPELEEAIRLVSDNCPSCALTGPPTPTKKISLKHVNENFNNEIQIDFTYFDIRGQTCPALHVADTGTGYSEVKLVNTRRADEMITVLDEIWFYTHGVPVLLSGDDEFNRKPVRDALEERTIGFKPRPTRRHNKCGIIERKNGTIKRVLDRIVKADSASSAATLVKKACFISNCLHGSKILSSFELARGYAPSIVGNPARKIPPDVLHAHKRQTAKRALHALLRSKNAKVMNSTDVEIGDRVGYYYNSSKANEKAEWREGKVKRIHTHMVEIDTGRKGRDARVAYEDLRHLPKPNMVEDMLNSDIRLGGHDAEGEVDEDYDTYDITTTHDETNDEQIYTGPKTDTTDALMAEPFEQNNTPEGKKTVIRDDLGDYKPSSKNITNERLASQEETILQDIKSVIGSNQVTASAVAFAPGWIVDKAMKAEHDDNWTDAYEEVLEHDLPQKANLISSHILFRVKTNDDGSLRLKGRIVVHGNRDDEKKTVRSDSAAADMMIVRLVASLAAILGFELGTADIKGAYMQSGPITREVYVRPPRDCYRKRGVVWKLLKLPYGMTDAGRQWQLRVEDWMLRTAGMERVTGVNQLFTKKDGERIVLIVAKVIDDFLIAGHRDDIRDFISDLRMEFEVGNTAIGGVFRFNGCEIQVSAAEIDISMWEYIERLTHIPTSRKRSKQREERATNDEETAYRALAGTIMYLGNALMPQASMTTSKMQQKLGNLRVKDLSEGNRSMREILTLRPYIRYKRVTERTDIRIISLSDAAHGGGDSIYGQTGGICGLTFKETGNDKAIYHPIAWTSHKQKRVTYSAFGAEILAAADADDRGYDLKLSLASILPDRKITHELFVDARALFDTITTLHEPREYRLRKTVARMRDSFENGELDSVKWIDGKVNLADALTKHNIELSKRLNEMMAQGTWDDSLNDDWRI